VSVVFEAPTTPMHRLRALLDRLVPWYDAATAARTHSDVRATIRQSAAVRSRAEWEMGPLKGAAATENDRIRRAYQAYADGFKR
jgi:hypothetical protein